MNIGSESYKKYADAHAPKSRVLYNSAMAFLIGGLICASAEAMNHLWEALGMTQEDGGASDIRGACFCRSSSYCRRDI